MSRADFEVVTTQIVDSYTFYTFFGCDQTKLPPGVMSFLGHLNLAKQHWLQTGFQCKQQSANTNTKLLTKHVSNTSQTKRAECKRADFDDYQTEKNFLILNASNRAQTQTQSF